MNSSRTPFVSVVMPVRNEASFIERSVSAVLSQQYPAERLELIVADGMSTDGTRDKLKNISAANQRVTMIDNPQQIAPTALNLAISRAKGDVIVRVDGHCEIATDYVSRCVEHLEAGEAECVGGPIETIGESYWARSIACAMSSSFGVGGAAFRTKKNDRMYVDTVAFPAMKRETLERAGSFDEEMVRNQDDEYSYRIRKMGARILLAPDIRSRYYSRSSLGELARQYFQYGYYKVRVMQKHPRGMSVRQFVPATFVVALTISVATAVLFSHGWLPLAMLLGSYCVGAMLFALQGAAKDGWELLPSLPVVFATLHLTYGTGFLVGLVKFHRRWSEVPGNSAMLARSKAGQ